MNYPGTIALPKSGHSLKRHAPHLLLWELKFNRGTFEIVSCAEGYRIRDDAPWAVRLHTPGESYTGRMPVLRFFREIGHAAEWLDGFLFDIAHEKAPAASSDRG